ncbi:unnamed protein product [Vicia faba]|uniref:HMA domain-containing protein n=1 Tax=Vicia faba TaxID=3906 RepID=A0AAV1AGR9_VICFA|nr:unnamed protein product [Vicia faba]
MEGGKEEKKNEKAKDMIEGKVEKKKDDIELIIAIYKLNLHCQECGNKIKKHLLTTQGVQSVEMDIEKGEIKAKGKLDPLKVLKIIAKKSNKKVELISPKVKPKEIIISKPKEIKDPIVRTISVKVHMHCDKCEADLKTILIKHKGIFNVKTDMKAQSLTVEGTIEVEKLLSFLKKIMHKNAQVISIKEEKKEEKEEEKKDKGKEEEKKDKGKASGETSKVIEIHHHGITRDDTKINENINVPYIIHYVYAPQLFSDENPNSCSIS